MATLPDDERLRELAEYSEADARRWRDVMAEYIRLSDKSGIEVCEKSIKRTRDYAAACRAVIAIRKAVSEVTDGRHLSDAMDEIEAILADAPARARRG